jgi:hypothetical protein
MILDSLVNKMEQIRNAEISEAISTAAQIIGAIEEFTVEMWLDYYDVFDLAVEKWSKPHKRTLLHDYIEAVYLEGQNYTLDKHFPGPVIKELKNILNAYNVDYSSVVETEHIEIYEDGCGNDEAEEYAGALQTFFIDNVLNRFIDDIFTVLYSDKNFLFEFNKQCADIIATLKKDDYPELLKEDGVFKRISNKPVWLQNGVRLRDKERCSVCGDNLGRILTNSTKVNYDHIIPLQKNGNNDPTNWQLTCETCNKSKGDRNAEFKNVFSAFWEMDE